MSLKSKARAVFNGLLDPLGLEIHRKTSVDRDSRPVSAAMTRETIAQCVPKMQRVAAFFGGVSDMVTIQKQLSRFFDSYAAFAPRQGYGSSGINALMTLHMAGLACAPDVVIESGVFEGFGSWALRAACPDAQMHCYDLSFEHLLYRDPTIRYHEQDWMAQPLEMPAGAKVFAFFDDHVNQARRVLEAAGRGVRWMVFDDNVLWHALHRDGLPPIPSIDMVVDETLADGATLDWVSASRAMTYTRDKAFDMGVRKKIARYERAPNLHDETGYPSTSMALVELR